MAKTTTELSLEMESLREELKKGKSRKVVLKKEWDEITASNKKMSNQLKELYQQIRTLKSGEKIAAKEAKLLELIKAKEEASKLGMPMMGRKKSEGVPEAVAAHRPTKDTLEGNLDEDANIDDLKNELDIF